MNDLTQDSLLREIDEDIRRERYAKLWKRYGAFVVGAAVALLVGVAGYQFWQYRAQEQRQEAATRFTQAVALAETDRAAAERALDALAQDGPAGYALLARLRQAALLQKSGDRQGARNVYQQLQQTAGEAMYRDLAVVLDTLVALEAETLPIDADALEDRLKPLLVDDNSWRFTGRELSAVLAWRAGRTTEARSLLTALAADAQAPADARERAKQFLAQIGES